MSGVLYVSPGALRTRAPFSTLFAIDPATRIAIVSDMRTNGFDASKPIDVWNDGGELTVVDGHTRLEAAKTLDLDEVPVYPHIFDSQLSALHHAFHNQKDRRNLEGAAFVWAVKIVDGEWRQHHGTNQHTRREELPGGNSSRLKSHEETAAIIGASSRAVSRARAIYDDPIAMKEVEDGVSISAAAEHATQRKKESKGRTDWTGLAQKPRVDDEPWFKAQDHGSICRSICGRAVVDIQRRLEMAREQGLDLQELMRENPKVRTEWNLALKEARTVTRLIRRVVDGSSGGDED